MRDEGRKQDTRKKIVLGGLVVKAGLQDANVAFLLGALLAAAKLDPATDAYRQFQAAGRAAFDADRAASAECAT